MTTNYCRPSDAAASLHFTLSGRYQTNAAQPRASEISQFRASLAVSHAQSTRVFRDAHATGFVRTSEVSSTCRKTYGIGKRLNSGPRRWRLNLLFFSAEFLQGRRERRSAYPNQRSRADIKRALRACDLASHSCTVVCALVYPHTKGLNALWRMEL